MCMKSFKSISISIRFIVLVSPGIRQNNKIKCITLYNVVLVSPLAVAQACHGSGWLIAPPCGWALRSTEPPC